MKNLFLVIAICSAWLCNAQTTIDVNLDVKHKLGDVESFDRAKFVTIHASLTEKDWDGDNVADDLRDDFLNGNDVFVGRNTGTISYQLKSLTKEDPARPGFADPTSIAQNGINLRNSYATKTDAHPYEDRNFMILCTQLHPFYPDGKTTNKGWAFSQTDTDEEPFGTASGEFYGRYIKESFGSGGSTGEQYPSFCEIVNEPLWDLVTLGDEAPEKIFRFHKTVASEVRKYNPDIPIGGYCTAFPDFDKDNFERWNERWKLFMDIAGEDMDYWTIHLYDFPSISGGKQRYRKGSNMEATMDMMEQYSYMLFGKVKPLMISEYGAQTHDYNKIWSPYRDWLRIKSTNSMMMQFMERANNINVAMPFIMNKAEWQYDSSGTPHTARLMRKENEPEEYTGQWVYAETAKIYELWSDVKGTRVDTNSDNLDIMCDAYVDGNKAYVIINNLEFDPVTFKLNVFGTDHTLDNIEVRHCYLDGPKGNINGVNGVPKLDIYNTEQLSDEIEIEGEATYILTYNFTESITIEESCEEIKYYADTYLQEIKANTAITFNINNVVKEKFGEAVLRIGIGREHNKELKPTVTINGTQITVPTNHRGGAQTDRDNFFGVLEIPVSYDALSENNSIEITYPEAGGYVSTVTLQAYNFSDDIRNRETAVKSIKQKSTVSIFPNPSHNTINVEADFPIQSILVYDAAGASLLETSETKNISIHHFVDGMYLIKVVGTNYSETKSFIKKTI